MTSQITFFNIKHLVVKAATDITKSQRKSGKLQVGKITEELTSGLKIDVLILKTLPMVIDTGPITINENDIRPGSRRQFTQLKQLYVKKRWLPVETGFFDDIENEDTILVILHEVET